MAGMVDGKVALVTGGGSGIGRATSLLYVREGAKGVVIADVNADGAKETCEMIEKNGGKAIFIKTDVTKVEDVQAMVAAAVEEYGRLDCASNIAGIYVPGQMVSTSEEDWNRTLGIDLSGVWRCMKYECQQMLKQGGGAVVNMASVAGVIGSANFAAYTAAKAGVVNLTRTAALELAKQGIRVNAVCPGIVRTPLVWALASKEQAEAHGAAVHPLGRLGEPEEIAEAVVWLASDRASFVTGEHLVVDGGLSVQ